MHCRVAAVRASVLSIRLACMLGEPAKLGEMSYRALRDKRRAIDSLFVFLLRLVFGHLLLLFFVALGPAAPCVIWGIHVP